MSHFSGNQLKKALKASEAFLRNKLQYCLKELFAAGA
jgi:hypothetical protein